ncbi:Inositol 2-dehydrogenase/D-chiro-inositol 3-dehydrogenase [subsurface metagenome]
MENKENKEVTRRKFMRDSAMVAAGLGSVIGGCKGKEEEKEPNTVESGAPKAPEKEEYPQVAKKADDINVALIGLGVQCERLMEAILGKKTDHQKGIEGIRFKAVCDIFPYRLKYISGHLKRGYKHDANPYESYEEMLDKEKDLQAAIIVTPDWLHAPMTIACLEAGLHVYCEKEMSNNLEDARKMVQTAQETGKLLQIGHQRRSNPRYQVAEKLIREHKLLGKVKNINAQWNRSVEKDKVLLPAKKIWMDKAALNKHGYSSMDELKNWRWYKKYGGGPLGDLGSHQIDIFSWFLGDVKPTSVLASGGNDYYKYEHNENVMAIYEYETEDGSVRAFYQVLNTTGWGTYGTYYETFMGDVGTLLIAEYATEKNNGWVFLERYIKETDDAVLKSAVLKRWNDCIRKKLIGGEYEMSKEVNEKSILKIGASIPGRKAFHYHPLLRKLTKPVHQPHLQNFFDAIRGKAELTCPGEVGYETAVAVLKANEAIEEGKKLNFKPEDFKV